MQLLYCRNGNVVGWHDSEQQVLADAYGDDVRVIPYDQPLATLAKTGTLPPNWKASDGDPRPYAAPTETKELLVAYAGQRRWEVGNGGIMWNSIPLNTDRVSQSLITTLHTYSGLVKKPGSVVPFTQDGVAYQLTTDQLDSMLVAVQASLNNARTVEAGCLTDLTSAAPTILTYDDVDARFADLDAASLRGAKKKKREQ